MNLSEGNWDYQQTSPTEAKDCISRNPNMWTRTSCGSWVEPETTWIGGETVNKDYILRLTYQSKQFHDLQLTNVEKHRKILRYEQTQSKLSIPFSSWCALVRLLWATIAFLYSATARFFFCFGNVASALWRRRWAAKTALRVCILASQKSKQLNTMQPESENTK